MTLAFRPHGPGTPRTHGIPPDELTAVLEAMRDGVPWRSAIRRAGDTDALTEQALTSSASAGFYLMLPVPSDRLAVDLGAGSGAIAAALASRFERVIAIDRDARWCEFMRMRFAEDKLDVSVVQVSDLVLPADARNADVVVMNGVLEWAPAWGGETSPGGRPSSVQLALLRAVHAALRRHGQLGIGVTNRWSYENLRGAAPQGEPYRTWTYGAGGYRRLLRGAGFTNIEVRAAVPNYHEPVSVAPLAKAAGLRLTGSRPLGAGGRLLGALARAGALGPLVHSFYISGERV